MADIQEIVASLPGLKDMSPAARQDLTDLSAQEIAGAHRWPFLLKVQQSLTWAANDAIQSFPEVSRIWSLMYPDSSGDYYRLEELDDMAFQSYIENNPDATIPAIWRDAGMDGNKQQIEIFPVPTGATTLKADYTLLADNIDSLPSRLHSLVVSRMVAILGNYGAKVAYERELQLAISREMDLQGKRSHVARDYIQADRMRNINNPT
jgi:hypothetical protein